ncbi:MAG: prepilin peptidase [Dehalococcoidales bacterium]|nr:prepilin peptidase [Dehalococcoidales bacterium]
MSIQLAVFFTLVGIAIGSFLNVCIDRLPLGRSLVSPPSHCDACQRRLGLLDLIPVFSYLFLRGHCRYCGARIPIRVFLVEFLTGVLFLLAFWRYGLTAQFGVTAFWCCVFLVIIFTDWEHKLILNVITYPAIVIAVVLLAVHTYVGGATLMPPEATLINGLISAAALFIFFFIIVFIRPDAMGMGDAKLVALIGLVSGFPLVVFSMIIGIVLGGIVAIVLLATKKKGRKDVIAYGTFLGIGPIIALIFAPEIINWYLSYF